MNLFHLGNYFLETWAIAYSTTIHNLFLESAPYEENTVAEPKVIIDT